MRDAKTVLGIIRERGRQDLPLGDVYRQLFNPSLYLHAYARIARNRGALTPGSTTETVDGMSQAKIGAIIDAVRHERYRWTPVRRTYIEKKGSTKKRPLGLPTWSDKLLQEVIRLILEAYYEPQFSRSSHGFRPGRGCHTALQTVLNTWTGTHWFIEGDIAQCYDRLDHSVMLAILRERIHDNRFLRLIEQLLKAGYLEDWRFHQTLSGVPQGGVVSPVLSNIYLDRLDRFVETTLLPQFNRGTNRKANAVYRRLVETSGDWKQRGLRAGARALRQQFQQLPSRDTQDPDFRRLRYVRYADDVLLGFSGPKSEAEEIKGQLGRFLGETLKLELSESKTLITHACTQPARFLGYEIDVHRTDLRHDRRGHRSINGRIGLKVPRAVIQEKCRRYMRRGKPTHLTERTHHAPFSIVADYQQEFRGLVEYYRMAQNLRQLNRLHWVMERSLVCTLAAKLKISPAKVYRRYRARFPTEQGPRQGLQVTVERPSRPPLVARWGGVSLARRTNVVLNDCPTTVWNRRTELLERLLADTCELCGSTEQIEVHHVRHLRTIQRSDRAALPEWAKTMIARQRTTLVTCRACHEAIHAGRPTRTAHADVSTGEPDPSKGRRPVRRGAVGKVPAA
jgi:group II intron reverse transcriptase/maturase